MFTKRNMVLMLVLVVGFVTRFYHLSTWPIAFAADEAALGYNAWSILTTGRDEWGKFFPVTMRSFDDWKPATYSYLAIPGVALFGLSEWTSRLPAAIFGALLPLFVYLLVKRTTGKPSLGILASLMIVISPWHIEISRTAIEAGVALSIFTLSLWFFASKKSSHHYWGLGLLMLTLFTYHTARLVAPLIVVSAIWLGIFKTKKGTNIAVVAIFLLGIILSLTASSSRYAQISIFNDEGAKLKREEAIREDGGIINTPLLATRMFHNKPLSWMYSFAESYIQNTSLSYLFLGGAQPPRVTIPETGQFLLIMLPLFLIGAGVSLHRFSRFDQWILFWLIIGPLPAALTYAELPHTYRTLFMLPPLAILMATGFWTSFLWIKKQKKILFWPAVLLVAFSTTFLFAKALHQYRVHQQVHQPWHRQSGYGNLISYLNHLEGVEHITITNHEGEPYIYILFYDRVPPSVYLAWPQKRLAHKAIESGESQWQLFNYTFSEESCPFNGEDINPNHIYVSLPHCDLPKTYEKMTTINFLDGQPEFLISRPALVKPSDTFMETKGIIQKDN